MGYSWRILTRDNTDVQCTVFTVPITIDFDMRILVCGEARSINTPTRITREPVVRYVIARITESISSLSTPLICSFSISKVRMRDP